MNKKEIEMIKQMILTAKKQAKKHNKWQAIKEQRLKEEEMSYLKKGVENDK